MESEASKFVVDASALLALIKREIGWQTVAKHLNGSIISAVNYSEVQIVLRNSATNPNITDDEISEILDPLIDDIIPFDAAHAIKTAKLHRASRSAGLSLGDCACLALGLIKKLPVITADSAWSRVDLGVKIVQIRN